MGAREKKTSLLTERVVALEKENVNLKSENAQLRAQLDRIEGELAWLKAAPFYIGELAESGLVHKSQNDDCQTLWYLTHEGRRYLAKRGLLT